MPILDLPIGGLAGGTNVDLGLGQMLNVDLTVMTPRIGTAGSDSIAGGSGQDIESGGAGADTLDGGAGDDVVYGGSPPAGLLSVLGVNASVLGLGATVAPNAGTPTSDGVGDTLMGGSGDDTLYGGSGNDVMIGGAGNDIFYGLDGGGDTAGYGDAASGVTVNLTLQGGAQVTGGAGTDTLNGIEMLSGSNFGDHFTGDTNANGLSGGGGADLLEGGDGADTLAGGSGGDTLSGGDGMDTASWADAASKVTVSLATNKGYDAAVGDVLSSIENLTGSGFDDDLTGDGGANTLVGDAGTDILRGGLGSDTLDGGNGVDGASWGDHTTAVIVDLAAGTASSGSEHDALTSIENAYGGSVGDMMAGSGDANALFGGSGADSMAGRDGADSLDGGSGDDNMQGDAGNDLLTGDDGNDALDGRTGSDTVNGGAGVDTVFFRDDASAVTANLANGTAVEGADHDTLISIERIQGSGFDDSLTGDANSNVLTGNAGNDTLDGAGAVDELHAGDGADSVLGGDGNDFLFGDAGNDTLVGGSGADTMWGGAGNDVFSFTSLSDSPVGGSDHIVGYAAGETIDLSGIDANATASGDQAFTVVSAFTHQAGQLEVLYDVHDAQTYVALDADGDGGIDFLLKIDGNHTGDLSFVL